jgi:ATP-binding cassette subfamily F protein 3
VEIRQSKLIRYRGNYDDYLEQREAHEEQLLAAFKNQEREIGRLMEFVNRFRAKNTKATQAQAKLKQIDRMEKVEAPVNDERKIDFKFPQPHRGGQKAVTLENIHFGYGVAATPPSQFSGDEASPSRFCDVASQPQWVYRGLDFKAERGQRIVLVGPNGAGKSTLLKILAGVVVPQSGTRTLGHNVKAGYYSQNRVEMLNPAHTVFEEALNTPQRVTEQFIRTLLGCFLFQGDDVFKKVSVLSGGEKSRLALVKLLLDPPNLLLMDEPTTHLDLASIDALAYALDQFQGTLIFISHDVYFIRALANHVVHVNAGQLTRYPGGYQYYLDKTKAQSDRAALTSSGSNFGGASSTSPHNSGRRGTPPAEGAQTSLNRKDQKRLEAERRQARSRGRKAQQEIVSRLEAEIFKLETRLGELTTELENPATYEKPGPCRASEPRAVARAGKTGAIES